MPFNKKVAAPFPPEITTVADHNPDKNSKESRLRKVGHEWMVVGNYNDDQAAKANIRQWLHPWGSKYEFKAEGNTIKARLKQ